MVEKGSWVTLEKIVLTSAERAQNLPEETRKTDLRQWVKGSLLEATTIGEPASVLTVTGRVESGILSEVNPAFIVNYGSYVEELKQIADQVRDLLRAGGEDGD